MMPILARLDKEISEAVSPLARAELLAERVCYMARIGEFTAGEQILQSIRAEKILSASPRVMIWVMLAEGVQGYFKGLDPKSRDRLLRAHGIAHAASQPDLERVSLSWLAHADFNRCDFDSMANHVRKYAGCSPTGTDAAAGRMAIVLADAHLYAGQFGHSSKWYESARRIAVDLGDEASLGAIMHGRAAFNSARARVNEVIGVREEEPVRFLRMEVDSSDSFHRATRQVALGQVTEVLKARVLQAEGRYNEACEIFLPIVEAGLSTSLIADTNLLKAELGVCLLRAGRVDEATSVLEALPVISSVDLGRDDQVIYWDCVLQLATGLSEKSLKDTALQNLEISKLSYAEEMLALRKILAQLEDLLN